MASLSNLLKIIPFTKKGNDKGVSSTPTFNPSSTDTVLTAPTYREHLTDLFTSRASLDSRELLKTLFIQDPDMSAAVNAFLTVADTQPIYVVRDVNRQIDSAGQEMLNQLILALTTRLDYSKGFKIVPSLNFIAESMRYMLLLRGAIGSELIVTSEFLPAEIRLVDMAKIEWFEKLPGKYTPSQLGSDGKKTSLDIPNFFVTWFRRDPTSIYTTSPFVSSINTIAARQQVINDLYRIMQLTGYPRMEVTVLEEVLKKNAPTEVQMDPQKYNTYLKARMVEITGNVSNIRADQAFVHLDSVKPGIMNEKSPAMALDISKIIEVLNAQNQAGLRTMATILGRGNAGVNTASVEARIFSMNAQELNEPIADILSQIFTMALRLNGSESFVEFKFEDVELRPTMELEPQKLLRSQRLRQDLSDGIITDDEYHLNMYGRLPPSTAPKLSGTKFMSGGSISDTSNPTPNSDPLGRSLAPPGKAQKTVKDSKTKQKKPKVV